MAKFFAGFVSEWDDDDDTGMDEIHIIVQAESAEEANELASNNYPCKQIILVELENIADGVFEF